jgi:flagellar hook-associated protein 3 FlgL
MRELDSLSTGNEARLVQYESTLSRLSDLDYAKALSDFARQQLALEASQKSFLQVSGLSLFSYL